MTTFVPNRQSHPELWSPPIGLHHHEPQPQTGHIYKGGRGWYGPLPSQAGGGPPFIVQNGIYVPLEYTNPSDPLSGGYGFCDWTDGGVTPHPGVDLNSGAGCNADEGVQVVSSVDGTVVAVLPWNGFTQGEGNHLWVLYDDSRSVAPVYAHFDHLDSFAVQEGQIVRAGELLGRCGRTGGWDCAHAHYELSKYLPSSWWQWPYGWSVDAVHEHYFDPGWWYRETVDKAGGMEIPPMDTTAEERAAMKPYFDIYGIDCNMETALMKRACLAYKREETPGPALSQEYPFGDQGYVRQTFTCRILEWHPDDGLVYYVEQNK